MAFGYGERALLVVQKKNEVTEKLTKGLSN
jgi:hypothetical protein